MDPDPAWNPDPTPDLTPLFSGFEDAKKKFPAFLLYNLPAGTLSSVLKIKFLAKKNFESIISVRSTPLCFMTKGKDPEPDPDPYL
jgi:hypothetical protein